MVDPQAVMRLVVGALAVVLVGATLGGCNRALKEEHGLAVEENEELRRRVAALESANQACEDELSRVEAQNAELADALAAASEASDGSDEVFGGETPEGVTVGQRGGDTVIAVAGDVLFASGKATLRSEAKRSLNRIAEVLKSRYASNTIRVEGHTDTDPIRKSGWKSNEHLSAERALAVERYLVERGVSNRRVYAAAFGPAKPRPSKQASRRVEIVVLASGG